MRAGLKTLSLAVLALTPLSTQAASPAAPVALQIQRTYSPAAGAAASIVSLSYAPAEHDQLALDVDGKRAQTNLADCPGLRTPLTALSAPHPMAANAAAGSVRYNLTVDGHSEQLSPGQNPGLAASADQALAYAATCLWPAVAPPALADATTKIGELTFVPVALLTETGEAGSRNEIAIFHGLGGFYLRLTERAGPSATPTIRWASSSTCYRLDYRTDALIDLKPASDGAAATGSPHEEASFDPAFNPTRPGNWDPILAPWWTTTRSNLADCWTAAPGRPRSG